MFSQEACQNHRLYLQRHVWRLWRTFIHFSNPVLNSIILLTTKISCYKKLHNFITCRIKDRLAFLQYQHSASKISWLKSAKCKPVVSWASIPLLTSLFDHMYADTFVLAGWLSKMHAQYQIVEFYRPLCERRNWDFFFLLEINLLKLSRSSMVCEIFILLPQASPWACCLRVLRDNNCRSLLLPIRAKSDRWSQRKKKTQTVGNAKMDVADRSETFNWKFIRSPFAEIVEVMVNWHFSVKL